MAKILRYCVCKIWFRWEYLKMIRFQKLKAMLSVRSSGLEGFEPRTCRFVDVDHSRDLLFWHVLMCQKLGCCKRGEVQKVYFRKNSINPAKFILATHVYAQCLNYMKGTTFHHGFERAIATPKLITIKIWILTITFRTET